MAQALVGLAIVGPTLRDIDCAGASIGDLLQILRNRTPDGQAIFAQPLRGQTGVAARGVQRFLCGALAHTFREQPGQRLVRRRQLEFQALAAAADGRR